MNFLKTLCQHSVNFSKKMFSQQSWKVLTSFLENSPEVLLDSTINFLAAVASSDSSLAMTIISADTVSQIKKILEESESLKLKKACTVCLGNLVKYSSEHCRGVENAGVLGSLLSVAREYEPNEINVGRVIERREMAGGECLL